MTKEGEIELKPIEKEKLEEITPGILTERESKYILEEIYNLLIIYYSSNEVSAELPKEAKWYLNQVLLVLEKTGIIVR